MTREPRPARGRCPVLVVDDHELVGSTMVLALQAHGVEAHRCPVTSRPQILATAAALPPGIVLLDLDLGRDAAGQELHGVDLVADLAADGWRVLVVTGLPDHARLAAAVAAGAEGVHLKTGRLAGFLALIEQAVAGKLVMSPAERRRWLDDHRRHRADGGGLDLLTARERAVLERLAAGTRASGIATDWGVSLATVRTHIRSVLAKLEVNSQLEAAARLRAHRGEG